MRRVAIAACGAMACVVAPFAACSGLVEPTAAEDSGPPDAADARPPRDYYVPPADAPWNVGPPFDENGWVRVDFDPHTNCKFYAAPSPDKMPAPIEWESCPQELVSLTGWVCRQVKLDWPTPTNPALAQTRMAAPFGWVDAKGTALLAQIRYTTRPEGDRHYAIVGEADGPVRNALYADNENCYLNDVELNGGKVLYTVKRGPVMDGKLARVGALGGDLDAMPQTYESWGDHVRRAYTPGPNLYYEWTFGELRPYIPWSDAIAYVPVPNPAQERFFTFQGDALYFQRGNMYKQEILQYTQAKGTRVFLSIGYRDGLAAADFGTDGKDMVWTEGVGKPTFLGPWTKIDIMTAPYTTEPSTVKKRRVSSEQVSVGGAPFTVGCGYAAHDYTTEVGYGGGVHLVRLSDGRSWRLGPKPSWDDFIFQGTHALAITCEEIFLRNVYRLPGQQQEQLVRLRLDSLGPGEPAD